jgi:hypothetical protein
MRRDESGRTTETTGAGRRGAASDVAILAGLCLVLLLPLLINGRTVLPVDWWGVTPLNSHQRQPHAYTTDPDGSTGNDLAWTGYTAESLRHGTLPLWDPFQGLGDTFLAQGGSQVLYPLNWLHAFIPVEYWDVPSFLHFFLAAWFVYLFALECGLARWPALIAGACVYAQGFMQGYLAMSMDLAASTWLPLVLFGVERHFTKRRSMAGFAAIAVGAFMLGTGSHQGLATVCAITVVAWIAVRCFIARDVRPALTMTIPFAIGVLCAAPVLIPFFQNTFAVRSEMGLQQANLGLRTLPSLIYPFVYGAFYSPAFGNPEVNPGDVCAPLPAVVWFLAIAGVVGAISRRNSRMLALAGFALWDLLWMTDVPPFNVLRYAPMLRRLGPAYLMCSIQLCLCVLAGYGVSALISLSRRELRAFSGVWIGLTAGLWLILASVLREAWPHIDPACLAAGIGSNLVWAIAAPALLLGLCVFLRRTRRENLFPVVALAAVMGAAVAFFPNGADYRSVLIARMGMLAAVAVCGLLVVAQRNERRAVWVAIAVLLLVNAALIARYPGWPKRTDPFAETPYVRFLKSQPQSSRGYGLKCVLFPDLSSRFSLLTINTLFALTQPTSLQFILRYVDDCQNPQLFYGVSHANCPDPALAQVLRRRAVWDYLGVRYVFSGDPRELQAVRAAPPGNSRDRIQPSDEGMRLAFSSPDDPVRIWENESARPIVYIAPQTAVASDAADAQAKLVSQTDLHRTAWREPEPGPGTHACASDDSFPPGQEASTLKTVAITPNRADFTIEAATPGTLVYVGSYAKGWTARIDNRAAPAFRVNGTFLGACVAAPGLHRVEFEYRPPFWRASLAAAAAGFLVLGFCLVSGIRARDSHSARLANAARPS